MKKKIVLLIGLLGTLFVSSLFILDSHSCYVNKFCNKVGDILSQDNLTVIFIVPFLFFFSLITYKMREGVFQAWWRFARWFVPVIMLVMFFQNIQSRSAGMGLSGVASGAFDFLVQIILYTIFIMVSIVKIVLAYRRSKTTACPPSNGIDK